MKKPLHDVGLLILRLSGLLLAPHGYGKVVGLMNGEMDRLIDGIGAMGFPLPVVFAWAAALSELVGGLCVALGLFTRIAAAFCAFTMLVAAFVRHLALQHFLVWIGIMEGSERLSNSGSPESALVYLIIFLALICLGGGRWETQRLFRRRKRMFGRT